MKQLFVIRDDDLNFFSTLDDIQWWYRDVFPQGIPVSFATIPFITGASDVSVAIGAELREYPIGENQVLCDYIRSNPLIEIMQHGCIHRTIDGVFEFGQSDTDFLSREGSRGKEHLENIFGPIKVFVAPHDTFSNAGIRAIEFARLEIIRSKGMKNFLPRFSYFIAITRMVLHRLRYPNAARGPAYPYVLSLGKHREAYAHRLLPDRNLMMEWLHTAHARGGNFIVTNHIHERDEERRAILMDLIKEAKRLGFTFAHARDVFSN